MKRTTFGVLTVVGVMLVLVCSSAQGSVVSVTEVGLAGDTPAIIATNFAEDALAFSDRTHEHNGAAFDSAGLLIAPTGPNIVPLPAYLLGNDYVRFANNARDNAGYSATVATNVSSDFYLLVDNRLDGPAGNFSSPNTTDPVLGGTL